ncbi:MAG: hypothetical protein K0S30_507 [Clostridia bacterium]|nr:hypothetical protein [Clostridia bacterium]
MLGLLVILVYNKINHIVKKVSLVNEAAFLYGNEKWIETEAMLQKAEKYKWFNYKEDILESYLKELQWITEFDPLINRITQEASASYSQGLYEDFLTVYKEYQHTGFNQLEQDKRQYLLKHYPAETEFEQGWKTFKDLMQKALNKPVDPVQYQWAKGALRDVPDEYFDGNKEDEIKTLFVTCDITLFTSAMAIKEEYLLFQKLLSDMNAIYETNKKYGYSSKWLTARLKPFIEKLIIEKSKTDQIREFANYAKVYQAKVRSYYKSQTVEDTIAKFIQDKEDAAKHLVDAQKYEEAIKIYQEMGVFKSYSTEISQVTQMEKYDHAELLLRQPKETYGFIKEGTRGFGGEKYIIGLQKGTGILELVVIEGTRDEYQSSTYETVIGEMEIKDILFEGELISLLSPSETRSYTYHIVGFLEEKLTVLLRVEANHVEVAEDGGLLRVNSPLSGYEGYDYAYRRTDNGYIDEGIIAQPVSLGEFNFTAHIGKVIRFDCYVPEEYAGYTALGMYHAEGVFYPDTAAELYLESGEFIASGYYTIVGEYLDNTMYHQEELAMDLVRPSIKILSMN